jgi:hypothetical protein
MIKTLCSAVLLIGCSAFGATETLQLVSAGAGNVMGGVYTSPYGISISGNGPTTTTLLICDDFQTDISLGETWTATETTLTQITAASVAGLKFGSLSNAVQDYATAAVLAAELMSLPNQTGNNAIIAGEYSYALWAIFDPALLSLPQNSNGYNTGYGYLTSAEMTAINADLSTAQAMVSKATTANGVSLSSLYIGGFPLESLSIYTPNPTGASQEFLGVVIDPPAAAEPAYPAVLTLDLLAVVGLIVLFRRRLTGMFE